MYTRSKSNPKETVKKNTEGSDHPKQPTNRLLSTESTKQCKQNDTYTDSKEPVMTAETADGDILSKLHDGQKQAKIAHERTNTEINNHLVPYITHLCYLDIQKFSYVLFFLSFFNDPMMILI